MVCDNLVVVASPYKPSDFVELCDQTIGNIVYIVFISNRSMILH